VDELWSLLVLLLLGMGFVEKENEGGGREAEEV
jgi:hypothetical protein